MSRERTMPLIYFVDEDVTQIRPFAFELELRQFEVRIIKDADEAFNVLWQCSASDVDLVLIDVMLSADPDPARSRFTRTVTQDFKTTGLALLRELIRQNPEVFPGKSILISMATSGDILDEIERFAKKHHVIFLRKGSFQDPFSFGEKIEELLQEKLETLQETSGE